jgi:phosphoglycerate-specific signal transduction histidine kinase
MKNDNRPADAADRRASTPFETMLERQLPQLTQRLHTTLDKLRNPANAETNVVIPAERWWRDLKIRHQASRITFIGDEHMLGNVYANVFDTVFENCLENARKKRDYEPDIQIVAELIMGDTPTLLVGDSGSAIPQIVVDTLFSAPVASSRSGGMGIGLYQAARQANESGFAFTLDKNTTGHVRFKLARVM